MALLKEIEKENGVVLNYHRITSINKITNQSIIVEVSSYISKKQRLKEERYQELQRKSAEEIELTEEEKEELDRGIDVLIDSDFMELSYDETKDIEDLYDYLKTTDKYKDAEDV